jgi:hypothetical protein
MKRVMALDRFVMIAAAAVSSAALALGMLAGTFAWCSGEEMFTVSFSASARKYCGCAELARNRKISAI